MQIPTLINRGRNGFNMTPMIDVVFLLIIFFLVASHLSDQDTQVEMELPTADSGVRPEPAETERVTLNVPEEGQVIFSGSTYSASELPGLIQKLLEDHGQDLEVRIRASRAVTYQTVAPILNACATVGVWNVTFAVYKKVSTE